MGRKEGQYASFRHLIANRRILNNSSKSHKTLYGKTTTQQYDIAMNLRVL
jgi:hypothetical protein